MDVKTVRERRCLNHHLFCIILLTGCCYLTWRLWTCSQNNELQELLQLEQKFTYKYNTLLSKNLPKGIIIGARKCGTRALLDFLDVHPQIRAAKSEVHYFDDPDNFERGLNWYRDQMPLAMDGQLTVEKSPAYFVTEEVPQRIKEMNESIRLILIVRDPVTRVISDYAQHVHRRTQRGKPVKPLYRLILHNDGTINTNIKMIRTSQYHTHLDKWLQYFPRQQIHLVDGDNLIKNPAHEVRQIEQFLQLQPYIKPHFFEFNRTKGFYCVKQSEKRKRHCLGDEKGRKHPLVPQYVINKLQRFYEPTNIKLMNLTGQVFSWMKHKLHQ